MNLINAAVSNGSKSVEALGVRGEQIGSIIATINDIADQTNLLALNAAIEAARAGEHGRGFAVVADEVRKLAERTTQATNEVSSSIQAIQSETRAAVERMEEGVAEVVKGVELAGTAGQSLTMIVNSSGEVTHMIQSIAAAAEEQSAAAEQVSRSVEAIAIETRETTEGTRQAVQAAADLSNRAESLRRLVSQFKV
jgi:methyl-accepting chemotaxis protein